jgi:hypothetical protein
MKNKAGSISNYLAALPWFVFGVIYLFKGSFMSYHSKAVSLQWSEIDKNMQLLLLGLMRAVSGGFIVISIVIIWLQLKLTEIKLQWIPLFILMMGVIMVLTTLYATIPVWLNTPGNPPIAIVLASLLLMIIGYVFNRKYINEK